MKLLVTGAKGQLGRSIKQIEGDYPELSITYTDVDELDITKTEALNKYFDSNSIDYLVNCAAYTAVDKAEENIQTARLLNQTAVENLAKCAEKYGFTLIHISTDYVFSGTHFRPYTEDDVPGPLSQYGKSKLGGEEAVLRGCKSGIVLRTSWLYSEFGYNFLKTILRLSEERDELKIIFDQIGTPTYAGDLAKAIMEIVRRNYSEHALFHFSNEGVASWYDFAREIISLTNNNCRLIPIPTEDYPLPAQRPHYGLMSKKKFTETFDYKIPHWKDSLVICMNNMHKF